MGGTSPQSPEQHPLVWRMRHTAPASPAWPTGHAQLDRCLPGGGWPTGALTELLTDTTGAGELSLLTPAVAELTRQGRWVFLIDPPWTPYPPALQGHGVDLAHVLLIRTDNARESLWAFEQALRGLRGGAVVAWPEHRGHRTGFTQLRRLQLASREGQQIAFMFRPLERAHGASPAGVRLCLEPGRSELRVHVLKSRGSRPGQTTVIRRPHPSLLAPADPADRANIESFNDAFRGAAPDIGHTATADE